MSDDEGLTPGQRKYTPITGVRGRGRYMKQRTHCPSGHPYAGENLMIETKVRPNGVTYEVRRCRICVRARHRAARERNIEAYREQARAADRRRYMENLIRQITGDGAEC